MFPWVSLVTALHYSELFRRIDDFCSLLLTGYTSNVCSFSLNPHHKPQILAEKPNTRVPSDLQANSAQDGEVFQTLRNREAPPKAKLSFPKTTSQEYGWDIEQAVSSACPLSDLNFFQDLEKTSKLMHRPKESSEITRYMASAWKQKVRSIEHKC